MHSRRIQYLQVAILIAAIAGSAAQASETIAEAEDLECAVCHDDPEIAKLSDKGRYYQYMRTLEGYDLIVERFGRCTYCHVKEAGSLEFTKDGYRFRWMMEDMEGLEAWLVENHPKPAAQDDSESSDKQEGADG